MAHTGSPGGTSAPHDGKGRGAEPILRALDEQFPEVRWGASPMEVEQHYPGGRRDPGGVYTTEHRLVGYPYPAILTFGFEGGLVAVTVQYPRSYDLATGDMDLPGRMVAESIYHHLAARLILAFGGSEEQGHGAPVAERGDQILADHAWATASTAVRLEFHLQNGLARLQVTLRAVRPG